MMENLQRWVKQPKKKKIVDNMAPGSKGEALQVTWVAIRRNLERGLTASDTACLHFTRISNSANKKPDKDHVYVWNFKSSWTHPSHTMRPHCTQNALKKCLWGGGDAFPMLRCLPRTNSSRNSVTQVWGRLETTLLPDTLQNIRC
jgi:hypothetical protein